MAIPLVWMNKLRELKEKYPNNPKKIVDLFYKYGLREELELNKRIKKQR